MRIICFLRGLGISISSISELMTEEDDPEGVISALIAAQERTLPLQIPEGQSPFPPDLAKHIPEFEKYDESLANLRAVR